MAKNRLINTKFWTDGYILELDPAEKLLFMYLFTNSHTNICGTYELSIRLIVAETGFDTKMVEKILKRFEEDDKFYYIDGWIYVKNFVRHQSTQSPTVKKGIISEYSLVPAKIRNKIDDIDKG
jgi:hypothetical protein